MGLSSLTLQKSRSDLGVDKPPAAAKLIERKTEGEGPTLHPSHLRGSLYGVGGGLPDLPARPLC